MSTKQTMTETLRKAMRDSGLPHLTISEATGVPRPSVIRFLRGEQSIRLDLADKLAEYFGLELRPTKPAKRKGK